jgi:hypothetical protein
LRTSFSFDPQIGSGWSERARFIPVNPATTALQAFGGCGAPWPGFAGGVSSGRTAFAAPPDSTTARAAVAATRAMRCVFKIMTAPL